MNATQQTTPISATGPAAFGVIAERFRRAGQPEKAVTLCREGLEKFPDHLSARVTLGWSLLDMGEHQEAFDQLKSVLKRAPDNLAAIRGLAELHERGIGLVFDSLSEPNDLDPVVASESDHIEMAGELDPVLPAPLESMMAGELDPVLPAPLESMMAGELDPVLPAPFESMMDGQLDPVMPAVEAAPPTYDEIGDLDPILEPEVPMYEAPAAYEAPAPAASRFEIEDVIDASETDSMFDLSGLLNSEAEPAAAPAARQPVPLFGGAPLALRDDIASEGTNELTEWLSRVRERRSNSVSQLMAG